MKLPRWHPGDIKPNLFLGSRFLAKPASSKKARATSKRTPLQKFFKLASLANIAKNPYHPIPFIYPGASRPTQEKLRGSITFYEELRASAASPKNLIS